MFASQKNGRQLNETNEGEFRVLRTDSLLLRKRDL